MATKTRKPLLVSEPAGSRITTVLDCRLPQPSMWHLLPADVRQRMDLLTVLRNVVADEAVPALDQEAIGLLGPYQPHDPRETKWCVVWTHLGGPGRYIHTRHGTEAEARREAARCNALCDGFRSLYRVERCGHVAPHACPPADVDLLSGAGYRLELNVHGWAAVKE
jgi:hypothetical protein